MKSLANKTQNVKALEDYINEVKAAWSIEEIFQRFGFTANGTSKKGSEVRLLGNAGLDINVSKGVWYTFGGDAGGKEVDAWYYGKYQKKLPKGEFMPTIYEMGDAAGIDRPYFSEEQKARYEERRTLEEIFRFTADFYHGQLPAEQRQWLHDRYGLTDETIDSLLIGYAPTGGQALYKHLVNDCHVAVEDVEKSGLFRLNDRGASDVFQGRIMFPYWNRNSVVYFIGRETDQTPKWEKEKGMKYAKQLVHGEKHPYVSEEVSNSFFYGEDAIRGAEEVFITEGVTDCIIANQAGFPTVSPVTVAFRDADIPKLIALLKNARSIYIINDNEANGSGRKGALSTAKAFWAVGKVVKFIELPRPEGVEKVDLNDFLREHSADDLRALLPTGKTLLDLAVETAKAAAGAQAKADATREVFRLIAQVNDQFMWAQWQKELSKALDITKAQFTDFLKAAVNQVEADKVKAEASKAAELEIAEATSPAEKYLVMGGAIHERKLVRSEETGEIETIYIPLCNFDARIVANVYRDDGENEPSLHMAITGSLDDGSPLPRIYIKASEYEGMKWVTEKWGARAIIGSGRSTKDKLREAIQTISRSDVGEEKVYTHTGFRVIDGQRVFLHAGGAIGMDGVNVELSDGMKMYELPNDSKYSAKEAMLASLALLDVGPAHVTYPILAMAYAAPLSEIIEPSFTGWIQGQTGSFKTSYTSVVLNHYGPHFDDQRVPIDWVSTENSIEKFTFIAKDVMLLVDDFRPPNVAKEADALRAKAGRIVTICGNRSGRSRMKADGDLRQTYRPRGLVVATSEKALEGHSINARMMTVLVAKDEISKDKLTVAQSKRDVYAYAMRSYIEMLICDWDDLKVTLPKRHLEYRNQFSNEGHKRIPTVAATLYTAFEVAMKHAVFVGAITEKQAAERCKKFYDVLVDMAEDQSANTAAESPALRYLQTIVAQVHARKLYIKSVSDNADLGEGDTIGWHDGVDVYFTPAAYNATARYLHSEGSLMPISEKDLRAEMLNKNWLSKFTKGRTQYSTRSPLRGGETERVIAISHNLLKQVAQEMGIPFSQLEKTSGDKDKDTAPTKSGTVARIKTGHLSDKDYGEKTIYQDGKTVVSANGTNGTNGNHQAPAPFPTGITAGDLAQWEERNRQKYANRYNVARQEEAPEVPAPSDEELLPPAEEVDLMNYDWDKVN